MWYVHRYARVANKVWAWGVGPLSLLFLLQEGGGCLKEPYSDCPTHYGWYKYNFLSSENNFIINNICVGGVEVDCFVWLCRISSFNWKYIICNSLFFWKIPFLHQFLRCLFAPVFETLTLASALSTSLTACEERHCWRGVGVWANLALTQLWKGRAKRPAGY